MFETFVGIVLSQLKQITLCLHHCRMKNLVKTPAQSCITLHFNSIHDKLSLFKCFRPKYDVYSAIDLVLIAEYLRQCSCPKRIIRISIFDSTPFMVIFDCTLGELVSILTAFKVFQNRIFEGQEKTRKSDISLRFVIAMGELILHSAIESCGFFGRINYRRIAQP